jgi:hypothetical protein
LETRDTQITIQCQGCGAEIVLDVEEAIMVKQLLKSK